MTASTDIALWGQLRNGDEKALYAFHQCWYEELLRYGVRLSGDVEETKEAINVVFAALWAQRHKLPAVTHPKAYLFTCVKNRLLRVRQQTWRTVPLQAITGDLPLSTASVEETIIELQEYEALKQKTDRLLGHLTDRQQELLRLRFIQEMSYEQIAQQLNISVRTVYNSIHESIKALRKLFDGTLQ